MIELVDYETYCKMTPHEKMLQRMQGLGEILDVTGWKVIPPEKTVSSDDVVEAGFGEAEAEPYDPTKA